MKTYRTYKTMLGTVKAKCPYCHKPAEKHGSFWNCDHAVNVYYTYSQDGKNTIVAKTFVWEK